jgi:alpha-ketoglutaric semialdehyde dehydrogenase
VSDNSGRVVALLVVDVQNDYLNRDSLSPTRDALVAGVAGLLGEFRLKSQLVAHVRTSVAASGWNAMPHRRSDPQCIEGTVGAEAPLELQNLDSEPIFTKRFFSSFDSSDVEPWLRANQVTTIVIAGLYTHACVRETAIDAYSRGFEVVIASDAIASDSETHASETLKWLNGRVATVTSSQEIISDLAGRSADAHPTGLDRIDDIAEKCVSAQPGWNSMPLDGRISRLEKWADVLEARSTDVAAAIVDDVQKPRALSDDEVVRAIVHIRTATRLARTEVGPPTAISDAVNVIRRPLGVVAVISPWNNPVALPAGKIAAALVCGNTVVLKPAPEAVLSTGIFIEAAREAGIPEGVISVVSGGPTEGSRLVASPHIAGVAVTGSIRTGQAVAKLCTELGKPIQAELGGNNAAIIAGDADLDSVIPALVQNAYAYSGQRCTAIRRWVVTADIADEFIELVSAEVSRYSENLDDTVFGSLISESAVSRVLAVLDLARHEGAGILVAPRVDAAAHLVTPTLVRADDASLHIVREETFGPVAVVQIAADLDDAIRLANGVDHGLITAVCSESAATIERVVESAQSGIVQIGGAPLPVHPQAPFGGWKASGIGVPEHGVWDFSFYLRPQAVYRLSD